ncbi:MAG: PAS domain-containing sensor histidine kinase [Pseudomonadota bacterium]
MRDRARRINFKRLNRLRKQRRVQNAVTLVVVALGPILAIATFLVLGPFDGGSGALALRVVLLADLVYVLVVAALVMGRVVQMIAARRAKSAGSRLHLRLTGTFAAIALVPTVTVAIFAALTINFGLEGWFSDRVRQVVGSSLAAAEAYNQEHRRDLEEDARALAIYLDRARSGSPLMGDGDLRQLLSQGQSAIQRGLREAFVIDGTGEIRARGERSYLFDFEEPSAEAIGLALTDGFTIIEDWDNNEFRALLPLRAYPDRLLYVSREVDGELLGLLDDTQATVRLYEQLEAQRGRILFEFGLLYLGFALILILAAVWLGLWFAERLSAPVGRLAAAAQRVGAGDLDVQVIEDDGDDEISMVGRLFNQMTRQLKGQREKLLENTAQIDRRRRLFDSVLSSVTSGVVGLDHQGTITFANTSAERLLDTREGELGTVHIAEAVPEFAELFEHLRQSDGETAQGQIVITRQRQQERLLVRMATRTSVKGEREGYVIAFDDVTDLVSAQRMAAWGDVARRIAHEIKNPLTPIQLSAERIRRKYAGTIDDDSVAQLTEVIIRQTGDLRRIVDEFSKFARMPEPDREETDLVKLLRDAVTLQDVALENVDIVAELPQLPIMADIDPTMISQAFTNLIKNAGEAIESLVEKGAPGGFRGEIRIGLRIDEGTAVIWIADNGIGLPQDTAQLFEPYVTTREKGTGLGLPIVRKIIEEHSGTLELSDAGPFAEGAHRGAKAEVRLPVSTEDLKKGAARAAI